MARLAVEAHVERVIRALGMVGLSNAWWQGRVTAIQAGAAAAIAMRCQGMNVVERRTPW